MDWYWWLIIAVVGIALIKKVAGGGKRTSPPDDELAFLSEGRERRDVAAQEIAKVVKLIEELSLVPPNATYANTLSRNAIYESVAKFMTPAGLTGLNTHTKMLHVVMSPTQITAFVKLRPTEPQTAVREFIRVGESAWAFRTRQVADMEAAVRAAEEETKRSVSQR
jgi:hypothetical protein